MNPTAPTSGIRLFLPYKRVEGSNIFAHNLAERILPRLYGPDARGSVSPVMGCGEIIVGDLVTAPVTLSGPEMRRLREKAGIHLRLAHPRSHPQHRHRSQRVIEF
ncbi:MAG: hypothetical protein AB7P76_10580 [Candidatus Melainabacteria bacterium]